MSDSIEKAEARHYAAAKELVAAIMREFPVGTIVDAKRGNGVLRGYEVCGKPCYWSDPGYLLVRHPERGTSARVYWKDILCYTPPGDSQ